jgi:hypothetical protein
MAAASEGPRDLVDGTRPPRLPSALADQPGTFVMTKVRVLPGRRVKRLTVECAAGDGPGPRTPVVERIGVHGRTITFRSRYSSIHACDGNPHARPVYPPWCGGAAWTLRNGRVSDPRLDLCYDKRSRPVIGFGWINPVRHAEWIVVDQRGYREVYSAAEGLPVRVSTGSGLGRLGSATFHIAQYDVRGVLLVRKKVVAAIAS